MIHHKRTRLVAKKIASQFDFDVPEQRLCFGIIAKALYDTNSKDNASAAWRYLENDLTHAEMCGVDPDWVRKIIGEVFARGDKYCA